MIATKVWCRKCSRFLGDLMLDGTALYFPNCQKCGERAEAVLSETRPVIDMVNTRAHNSA